MNNNLVEVFLKLKVERGTMMAQLQFANVTGKKIYLDEETICFYNEPSNNFFLITDEKGQKISYTGMMGKRRIDPEFFRHLNPDEKIETSIDLSKVYKMEEGKKYVIQYTARNPRYLNEQDAFDMQSNKVEILYQ
jgi:hypothetical protein